MKKSIAEGAPNLQRWDRVRLDVYDADGNKFFDDPLYDSENNCPHEVPPFEAIVLRVYGNEKFSFATIYTDRAYQIDVSTRFLTFLSRAHHGPTDAVLVAMDADQLERVATILERQGENDLAARLEAAIPKVA